MKKLLISIVILLILGGGIFYYLNFELPNNNTENSDLRNLQLFGDNYCEQDTDCKLSAFYDQPEGNNPGETYVGCRNKLASPLGNEIEGYTSIKTCICNIEEDPQKCELN